MISLCIFGFMPSLEVMSWVDVSVGELCRLCTVLVMWRYI